MARIEMASKASSTVRVIVPGRLACTYEAARGYNRANLCLSLQAHILAPTKSRRLSAQAGWAKCIERETRGSSAL